jgi:TPR repeat protein
MRFLGTSARSSLLTAITLSVIAGCATAPPAPAIAPTRAPAAAECIADEIPATRAPSEGRVSCGRGIAACEASCMTGNANACLELAYALEAGNDAQQRRATDFYAHACRAGVLNGCTNYAATQRLGKSGLRRDLVCTTRVFERTCSGDEAWGCGMLGQALLLGEGTATDTARAAAVLRGACERAPGFACAVLADAQDTGLLPSSSPSRVRELYRRACEGGVESACEKLESTRTPSTPL